AGGLSSGELIDNPNTDTPPIGRTARTTSGLPRTERSIFRTLRRRAIIEFPSRTGNSAHRSVWSVAVLRAKSEDMNAGATVSLSSLPVRTPPEIPALQEYAQISSGAESLFPLLMSEDVFSEVHP
ncbi:MAG: hypothetical protein WB714_34130, partial [Candidatus Sulfotelmatobacter sp.]